jgi:hypothetical protein
MIYIFSLQNNKCTSWTWIILVLVDMKRKYTSCNTLAASYHLQRELFTNRSNGFAHLYNLFTQTFNKSNTVHFMHFKNILRSRLAENKHKPNNAGLTLAKNTNIFLRDVTNIEGDQFLQKYKLNWQ